jgi:hypothetical protein
MWPSLSEFPQMELRYEYNDDGSLKRTSAVDQTAAEWSTYGPEKYVVEYEYDSVGRVARKVVRDTPSDDDSTRFEVDYTYDGRGQYVARHRDPNNLPIFQHPFGALPGSIK